MEVLKISTGKGDLVSRSHENWFFGRARDKACSIRMERGLIGHRIQHLRSPRRRTFGGWGSIA